MSLARPFFALSRELRVVPPGMDVHPGVPAARIHGIARRIDDLAQTVTGTHPKSANALREVAVSLVRDRRLCGLSRAETAELAGWLSLVGGVIASTEPEEHAA